GSSLLFRRFPCFFIEEKPLLGQLAIGLVLAQIPLFQILAQLYLGGALRLLSNRLVDEAAAVPLWGDTVKEPHGIRRQRDVDPLMHVSASRHFSIIHTAGVDRQTRLTTFDRRANHPWRNDLAWSALGRSCQPQ